MSCVSFVLASSSPSCTGWRQALTTKASSTAAYPPPEARAQAHLQLHQPHESLYHLALVSAHTRWARQPGACSPGRQLAPVGHALQQLRRRLLVHPGASELAQVGCVRPAARRLRQQKPVILCVIHRLPARTQPASRAQPLPADTATVALPSIPVAPSRRRASDVLTSATSRPPAPSPEPVDARPGVMVLKCVPSRAPCSCPSAALQGIFWDSCCCPWPLAWTPRRAPGGRRPGRAGCSLRLLVGSAGAASLRGAVCKRRQNPRARADLPLPPCAPPAVAWTRADPRTLEPQRLCVSEATSGRKGACGGVGRRCTDAVLRACHHSGRRPAASAA